MQSRLLHRDLLILVDLVRIDHIEQRPNLSARDHVVIVGPARSRPGRLPGGVLHQLSDFFFQRHLLQNRFHSGIELRVRDAAGWGGDDRVDCAWANAAALITTPRPHKRSATEILFINRDWMLLE